MTSIRHSGAERSGGGRFIFEKNENHVYVFVFLYVENKTNMLQVGGEREEKNGLGLFLHIRGAFYRSSYHIYMYVSNSLWVNRSRLSELEKK